MSCPRDFRVEILALAPQPGRSGQWRWVWTVYADELTEHEATELCALVKTQGHVCRVTKGNEA